VFVRVHVAGQDQHKVSNENTHNLVDELGIAHEGDARLCGVPSPLAGHHVRV